ncbi:hypothetical protein [Planosporangium mesophilum]|uniref:Uncharacterized protein n=1 Tax=Planosporangium mesophilum TaxID=689768 RepID=A0A8J3X2W2_9ACTN|nr:hypothetical protein [Planosporangium mesophilum]NJC85972.1 hypothetical protein [Planosporangium mesophilum]GII25927.1 hypothetical protein Pme01_55240 [Planosporangium mesophilum]
MSAPATPELAERPGVPPARLSGRSPSLPARWAPFAAGLAVTVAILLYADTGVVDLARYAGYAVLTVALPGTLLYRALRRTPHTFVEDVAMGTALGLTLELAAWAVFSALDLRAAAWLWPLAVVVPFLAVPRLRQHWRVRGYAPTPLGWSWSVAGVVAFFTWYLSQVFLLRNPILPTSETTRQYVDLPYQLSLAGEAKHHLPLGLPQVAGEPLYYHWFGYVHMAMTSLVGHIDLPVVALRLAVPALSVAAIVLSAVVGWRVSGRPYVGVITAVLFWVVGEVNFTTSMSQPFGTQVTLVVWHGMSMIYSWVLLIALIGVLGEIVGRADGNPVPALGRGAYVMAALLLVASSGAKASSLPVTVAALAFAGAVLLVTRRRIPWGVVAAGALAGVAQLFAMAVLFNFQTYGLSLAPLGNIKWFWYPMGEPRPAWKQLLVEGGVFAAFLINMQARVAGVAVVLARRRLAPVQWLLLGGALAGPALYLTLGSINAQYFTRAGFTFGVILSAWGYVLLAERAGLSARGRAILGATAAAVAVALVAAQLRYAGPTPTGRFYSPLVPIATWSLALAAAGLVATVGWLVLRHWVRPLRGKGVLVALTMVFVAGAPGLVVDAYATGRAVNGDAQVLPLPELPRSRVDAARWVRGHSGTGDTLATNVHCLEGAGDTCDSRSFWLSAYAEREVLVEGWRFAPRMAASPTLVVPFWDQPLLALNDAAFTAPTPEVLGRLRDEHHVRWLVADRRVGTVSPLLGTLATPRYDNGRVAVFELR